MACREDDTVFVVGVHGDAGQGRALQCGTPRTLGDVPNGLIPYGERFHDVRP